jgi:PEP-CTERM motif
MKTLVFAAAAGALVLASPTLAATNLIRNGSFEAGLTGTGTVPDWTRTNTPDNSPTQDQPAAVIGYNNNLGYPTGAYGEMVTPDSAVSESPDAVGSKAAYFVGDHSVNETWSQLTYLGVGNYKIGFSYYLTANGLKNVNNASLSTTILGIPVATTLITATSTAKTWFYASGVAQITTAGHYLTSLVFNSNGAPAKDIVVDRVFGISTDEEATAYIPDTPSTVPEPQSWALMIAGFGLVGVGMRRQRRLIA